jgi:phospholipid/cholesterol/gamma-HCH transport system permease protein
VNAFLISGQRGETITLTVSGDWSIHQKLPSLAGVQRLFTEAKDLRRLAVEAADLKGWDSALLSFLFSLETLCRDRGIMLDSGALPAGLRRLTALASSSPQSRSDRAKARPSFLARVGAAAIDEAGALRRSVAFLGESMIGLGSFIRGRARYRRSDLLTLMEECGAQALPIVTVISLLIGMIFAFVGAVQLKQFGADIYDANLVAVAMSREMAAVMTGIVLAGRTGAAFAAQIGAMQGNEEIDALSTLGISAIEFLVIPRMLALILMTPLLCIYANAMGLLGGYIVAMGTLNVTSPAYLLQTQLAVTLGDFSIGIFKSVVFGALVAVTGCMRGIESGRSAAAVGQATTSAVVSGILSIIVADAIFSILLNILGL